MLDKFKEALQLLEELRCLTPTDDTVNTSSDERHIRELMSEEQVAIFKYEQFATESCNEDIKKFY